MVWWGSSISGVHGRGVDRLIGSVAGGFVGVRLVLGFQYGGACAFQYGGACACGGGWQAGRDLGLSGPFVPWKVSLSHVGKLL